MGLRNMAAKSQDLNKIIMRRRHASKHFRTLTETCKGIGNEHPNCLQRLGPQAPRRESHPVQALAGEGMAGAALQPTSPPTHDWDWVSELM